MLRDTNGIVRDIGRADVGDSGCARGTGRGTAGKNI